MTAMTDQMKDLFPGRRWLRYAEAGALLGVTPEAVRMMVRRGRLPFSALGKCIYIDREDIEKVLVSGKVTLR